MDLATMLWQTGMDSEAVQRAMITFFALLPVFLLIGIAIVIVPFWFILKKAGFSPWLSLLCLIPGASLILLYVLAFGQWKTLAPPQWAGQPPYPPSIPPQV
jgi:hypothetical protein